MTKYNKWMFVWSTSMIVCGTIAWMVKDTCHATANTFAFGWMASAIMYVINLVNHIKLVKENN